MPASYLPRYDDHASAAANLLSLIASAKLHDIDPEQYLAELIHVMPYWPRERYLELAPFRWKQTRARLGRAPARSRPGYRSSALFGLGRASAA